MIWQMADGVEGAEASQQWPPMPLLSLTLFWWAHFHPFLMRILFTLFHPFLVRNFVHPFSGENLFSPFSGENICSPFSGENILSAFSGSFFSGENILFIIPLPFLVRKSSFSSLILFWWELFFTFSGENFVHAFLVRTSSSSSHPFLMRNVCSPFSGENIFLFNPYPFLVRTSPLWWVWWWFINQSTIHMLPNWMSGFGTSGKNKSADGYMLWPPELHFFEIFFGTLSNKSADGYMLLLRHQNYTETHYWPCRMPHPILNKKYAQTFPNIRLLQNLKERCEKMKQLLTQLYKNESNILEADIYVSMTRQVHVSGNYKNECLL